MLAADVGAGEPAVVAQGVGEQAPRGHPDLVHGPVHPEAYVVLLLAHALLLAWSMAAASTRGTSTRTRWAR